MSFELEMTIDDHEEVQPELPQEEELRLWSKPTRAAVDPIPPEQREIHADLERWGMWNRERYRQGTCASLEKGYLKGGRDATPAATAPSEVNPRNLQVERAVIRMPMQHGESIKLYYVAVLPPPVICRRFAIRWRDFGTWMFDARAMVMNLLRAL